jgi:hypothetical protein
LDYKDMRREELEAQMERMQRDLEDLEETIGFNLINTSAHISGGQVRKDEACLTALREQIAVIRQLLDSSKA